MSLKIVSKANTKEYQDNWDRIFKNSEEESDDPWLDEPLTEEEKAAFQSAATEEDASWDDDTIWVETSKQRKIPSWKDGVKTQNNLHEAKLSEKSRKMLQEGLDDAIAGRMTKIPDSVFKIKKNKRKAK